MDTEKKGQQIIIELFNTLVGAYISHGGKKRGLLAMF